MCKTASGSVTAALSVAVVALFMSTGCGSTKRDRGTGDIVNNTGSGTACTNTSECTSPEVCNADNICALPGAAVAGTGEGCDRSSECPGNTYCRYETVSPWDSSQGTCEAPCNGDCGVTSNGVFQSCINGVCYTEANCTPGNDALCPPGEVCNAQTHTCSSPPSQCYFDEQCPTAWVCNSENVCIDPVDTSLGGCSQTADCASISSCANDSCSCISGACRPIDGCRGSEDCPNGNYCAAGTCRPAPSCTSQDNCTPYGLECRGGTCSNPTPCNNGACAEGYTCQTNFNPAVCMPDGANQCTRDDQCPATQYCELFTGTCAAGCRNSLDCSGQCNGATPCNCDGNHACINADIPTGGACADNTDCPGGLVCAADAPGDFMSSLLCGLGGGLGGGLPGGSGGGGADPCAKSCKMACDSLASGVQNTCPTGETCTPPDQIAGLLGGLFGGGSGGASAADTTASVCYPAGTAGAGGSGGGSGIPGLP